MEFQADNNGGHISARHAGAARQPRGFELWAAQTLQGVIDMVAPSPWTAHTGCRARYLHRQKTRRIYTPEQRKLRDESPWTLVQGILAPVQFLVFLGSLALVIGYLVTGDGYALATGSVVAKTLILYTIMITGSIWEKVVFDHWLFAPAFFWEDAFSMLVLALHTAYLAAVFLGIGTPDQQMVLALAAYATYVVNAVQFLWKLRIARLEGAAS
jgi:3-vinyl bacteriochlorophyllide hydratase